MRLCFALALTLFVLPAGSARADEITIDLTGTVYAIYDRGPLSHVSLGDQISWTLQYNSLAPGTSVSLPWGPAMNYAMSAPVLTSITDITRGVTYALPTDPGAANSVFLFGGSTTPWPMNGPFTATSSGTSGGGAWSVNSSLFLGNEGDPTFKPLSTTLSSLVLGSTNFTTTNFHYGATDGSPSWSHTGQAFWFDASVSSISSGTGTIQGIKTPEPGALLLVLVGGLGLFLFRFWPPAVPA